VVGSPEDSRAYVVDEDGRIASTQEFWASEGTAREQRFGKLTPDLFELQANLTSTDSIAVTVMVAADVPEPQRPYDGTDKVVSIDEFEQWTSDHSRAQQLRIAAAKSRVLKLLSDNEASIIENPRGLPTIRAVVSVALLKALLRAHPRRRAERAHADLVRDLRPWRAFGSPTAGAGSPRLIAALGFFGGRAPSKPKQVRTRVGTQGQASCAHDRCFGMRVVISRAMATKQDDPTSEQLARMAIAGDVEGLFGLMDGEAENDRDGLVYKWLVVASDFGHDNADEYIDGLLEASSLRYDDDQFETGNAHWELAQAYLTATEGLPRDLERGRTHLEEAKTRHYPMSVQGSDKMIADARAPLPADARAVFDAVYDGSPPGADDDDD